MKKFLSLLTSLVFIFIVSTASFAHEKSPPIHSASDTYFITFKSKSDSNVIKWRGNQAQYKYVPVIVTKLPEK